MRNQLKEKGRASQCVHAIRGVTKASDFPIIMGIVPLCFYQKDNPNKLSP